jgi:hypothetical protein
MSRTLCTTCTSISLSSLHAHTRGRKHKEMPVHPVQLAPARQPMWARGVPPPGISIFFEPDFSLRV